MTTKPYKAVVGFVLSFLAALLALVQDKTEFTDLTPLQWLIAVVSALVVSGGVYFTTNPPTAPSPPNARGAAGPGWLGILGVVVLLLVVVLILIPALG